MTAEWWDEAYDVVVVGGGGAGLMAAVEAATRGAEVLLIEKRAEPGGGATGMSVGSITAAGTAQQRAAGIDDDVDAHFRTVHEMAAAYPGMTWDLALSRLMVEWAPRAVARLTALGVQFSGPHPEVPHPVYRMVNAVPGSAAYIEVLTRAAHDAGVTIRTDTTVDEIQRSDAGAVSMLAVRHVRSAQPRAVLARRAVVLAAGDFSGNDELGKTYGRPPEVSAIPPLQLNATGDGHQLGLSLGAAAVAMERTGFPNFRTVLAPYVEPDRSLFVEGAILVNLDGCRFANELGRAELATDHQRGHMAYVVFDSRVADRIATAGEDSPRSRDGWYRNNKVFMSTFPGVAYAYLDDFRQHTGYLFEAATSSELAAKLTLPPGQLERTLETFNAAARGDCGDAFGRDILGPGVGVPPFYAVGPIRPILVFSGGGLRIDHEMHVLDEAGRPIPHLYACGSNAEAGVFLGGHGHHLAWAFGTGLIAGHNATAESPVAG